MSTPQTDCYWNNQLNLIEKVSTIAKEDHGEGVKLFDQIVATQDVHETTYNNIVSMLDLIEQEHDKEAIKQAIEDNAMYKTIYA